MKPFRMKQFSISQHYSSMKVGTDGVLLGAYMAQRLSGAWSLRVLDVGTGTGLIALMIAQVTPGSLVYGIELDKASAHEARRNFEDAPFSERVCLIEGDFRLYKPTECFDVIVSNPPYYTGTHGNLCERETRAKHAVSLTPSTFFAQCDRCLVSDDGMVATILATTAFEYFARAAHAYGLFASEMLYIKPRVGRKPKRVITIWRRTPADSPQISYLTIEREGRHCYTDEYKELLKPYLIIF